MSAINFGCQTYSWQMSYEKNANRLPEIMGVMKQAGFAGIEAEICMMGEYFNDWAKFKDLLAERGLKFAALAMPLHWLHPEETGEERAVAEKALEFVGHFQKTVLLMCHLPGKDRKNLHERQNNQIECISAIGRRAANKGVVTAFHPNSSYGSAFRTQEDYHFLLERLAGTEVGFCPDAGHIAHGGMDPGQMIKAYDTLVRHVHFKDMAADGTWASMGKGRINFKEICKNLSASHYNGWVIVEEESAYAEEDPDAVTVQNGTYVSDRLLPCLD